MESETTNGATNGTAAGYGRACAACARAKCRCIYRPGDADCERCHRLGKECVPSVSVRKRNGKRAHVSRAAQLEAKLEDLVTLLRHQTTSTEKAPSPGDMGADGPASTPARSARSTTGQSERSSPRPMPAAALPPQPLDYPPGSIRPRAPVGPGTLLGSVFNPPASAPAAPTYEPVFPMRSPSMPSCSYQPHPLEAAEDLMTFRKYMLIFLPFVYLPPSMTSEGLRETYPFLWFSIMTVTCKHADRRLVMGEAVKSFLAQKIVIENDKSLDLLLGLIVILGWTQFHMKRDKPMLSMLASLTMSLVFDLGLNKVPAEPYISACLRTPVHPPVKEKTHAERRAVLACFLLTSQISYAIKRLDALQWTAHMDECLQALSEQREWEGDDLLVAQVKVQLIVEQLTRTSSQSTDGIPPGYVLSALRAQLQTLKAQLPPHLQQNDTILSQISYAEVAISEVAMSMPKTASLRLMPDMQRHEAMEACLSAIRDWFNRHFSIPNYVYIGKTFSYWFNMAHCLLVLARLSVLDDPAWSRQSVRDRIDLLAVLDQLGAGLEEVAAQRRLATGPTVEEDTFSKYVRMVQTMKNNWAEDLAATEGASRPSAPTLADAFIDNSAEAINVPFFQPDDTETWIAGLFDMNWDM
ncbi:hypothetical protein N658DRAFT_164545 [Parathielavia hyrcaniae]|uniref:Zn(2)-C6 fungal-type domain-containing protein n=1 Tax=Parathielavia hyrcaniae TaxID=113614 RepID=A0AAN6PWV6_9PEZI|nr:hypothetical protein N658DRAFT_164545 [Parathielavia hyrcaniae]